MRAEWIWYPGDFELDLYNKVMLKRTERDVPVLPVWRTDSIFKNVSFTKTFVLKEHDEICIKAEGLLNIQLDEPYKYVRNFNGTLSLKPGAHSLTISVYNDKGLPCLFVKGREIVSGADWKALCHDNKERRAACGGFFDPDSSPDNYTLPSRELQYVRLVDYNGKLIYDFGKEIMASPEISELNGCGSVNVFYGESLEEAADYENCELTDTFILQKGESSVRASVPKAFRYLSVAAEGQDSFKLKAFEEYLPLEDKSSFSSNDAELNKIYETSLYTLRLNTREFFMDGIKRDRWVWSGDAYQSYLMNYYSFFDKDITKRTILALAGREPYKTHINHIMDYTFFWILGVADYYEYTGDIDFISEIYPIITGYIEFCISRTNGEGLMEGLQGDWVFVDWAPIDNRGEVCFEQMLYYESLKRTAFLARLINDAKGSARYQKLASAVKKRIEKFWDEEQGGYIHSYRNGVPDRTVTKYANIFAVLFSLCGADRKERIKKNAVLNDGVQKITTPYMRFYELAALCELKEYETVVKEIKAYWGGMLNEGATTFWEAYDPSVQGVEKFAMYGRKYGKSLCHAWGASPVYLFGRYFAGLRHVRGKDYDFEISPCLHYLGDCEITLPAGSGSVKLIQDGKHCIIKTKDCDGFYTPAGKGEKIRLAAGQEYKILLKGSTL